jgi:hypothetical protein
VAEAEVQKIISLEQMVEVVAVLLILEMLEQVLEDNQLLVRVLEVEMAE